MAKEQIQIQIDAAVKSAEAAKSLGELKRSLMELNTLQAQLGEDSGPQFDQLVAASAKASSQLAETRDRIGDIQDKTRTLEGTPIERLTGSFGLLKESIMNLDFDKAKIGLEGLTNAFTPVVDGKLVSGFAGIKGALGSLGEGVKSLGSTFMSVGKALLTNPIFLLVAAFVAITAAILIVMDKLGILKKVIDALMIPINAVIKGFEMLTDWLGLTTNAQEEAAESAKKLGEEQRAEIDATAKRQQQHLKDIENMTADEIAEYKKKAGIKDDLNKSSFDIEKDRLEQTQVTLAAEINALNELEAAGGELTDEQKKDLEQRKKDYQANADAIIAIDEQKQKAIIENSTKASQTLRDWQIKNIKDENDRAREQSKVQEAEDIRKLNVAIEKSKRENGENSQAVKDLEKTKLEIQKFYNQQRETITQAENKKAESAAKDALGKKLAEEEKKYQLLQNAIEKERQLKLSNTKLTGDEIAAINKEYDRKAIDQQNKTDEALFQFKKTNKIIKGKDLQLEEDRINANKAAREEAFTKGVLDLENKNRKAAIEKKLSDLEVAKTQELAAEGLTAERKIEIQKSYDESIFAVRRDQILNNASIELADTQKTEDEKAVIRNKAFVEITNLEAELNQKRQEYATFDAERNALFAETLVSQKEFEIEQLKDKNTKINTDEDLRNKEGRDAYIKAYREKAEGALLISDEMAKQLSYLNAREVNALQAQMELELSDTELTEAEKFAIKEKYRQLNLEQEQNAEARLRELKLQAVNEALDYGSKSTQVLQGFSDAVLITQKQNMDKENAARIKNLQSGTKEYDAAQKKNFEVSQAFAKKQFNTNRALQLANAIIDGFKAITSSLAQSPVAIGAVPNPAGIASLAFAIATSAANIAKIAATKFTPGAEPAATFDAGAGAPSTGGGGEGGGVPTMSPNQFFGLGQTQPGGGAGSGVQKVYVVESDITSTQERVAVIESRAVLN